MMKVKMFVLVFNIIVGFSALAVENKAMEETSDFGRINRGDPVTCMLAAPLDCASYPLEFPVCMLAVSFCCMNQPYPDICTEH